MVRTIEQINVVDVEKRKIPSKHYVYVIYVTWSDSSTNVIYRRYCRFFDFQTKVMDMFPEESGVINPEKRIIPFLPGKKFFGRSHIRDVAVKRMGPIAEYCKAIVKLPRRISHCRDVMEFFELEPDDINPPKGKKASIKANKISSPKALEVYVVVSEYKKQENGEISLQVGMHVEIVEKTETGWWFVNVEDGQGWIPSTCLEREDGTKEDTTVKFGPGDEQQYLCTEEFKAQGEDELSMDRGAVVDVIEKNLEGWWRVRYDGKEGYVPATFLMKTETFKIRKQNLQRATVGGPEIVKSLLEISDLLKDEEVSSESNKDNNDDDDEFDTDDVYSEPVEEEMNIYTIHELSKILKEDKRGSAETEKVYESIRNMKKGSLKRNGTIRPPPRPSIKPKKGGNKTSARDRPPIVHSESFCMEYVTIADFADAVGDGISFKAGQSVKVLEKNESGWWFIEIDNREGWAPATYIESTNSTANVTRPHIPSPINLKKPKSVSGSREDLTDDNDKKPDSPRRQSAVEAFGGLANALKTKLNTKNGGKIPPPPPKKDFLAAHSEPEADKPVNSTKPFFVPKSRSDNSVSSPETVTVFPVKPGKKVLDRSMQPPPPPPPVKVSPGPPPPPPPVKKPVFTETKTESFPIKPKSDNFIGGAAFAKPKPPAKMKNTVKEPENDGKVNVAGLAGALKAKFELQGKDADQSRNSSQVLTQKPTDTESKHALKPSQNKPELPAPHFNHKPKPAVPNVPSKPNVGLKPHTGNKPSPPRSTRPSWAKNVDDTSSKSDEDSPRSDFASVLKSKFEKRQKSLDDDSDTTKGINTNRKESHPPPPAPAFKPILNVTGKGPKPSRPVTPPTPRRGNQNQQLRLDKTRALSPAQSGKLSPKRPSSPKLSPRQPSSPNVSVSRDSNLDPKKYSARPLPAKPPGLNNDSNRDEDKSNVPNISKPAPPSLPSKPKLAAKTSSTNDRDMFKGEKMSNHSGDEGLKPVGVSGLANMLKAKIGTNMAGGSDMPKPSPCVPIKPKQNASSDTRRLKQDKIESDIKNNNAKSTNDADVENLYCAIADFIESNDGEISLSIGQEVELLEKADGWWFVSSNSDEGWVPSAYLEKIKIKAGGNDSESDINYLNPVTGPNVSSTKQAVFRTCSDFTAENEGELNVSAGQSVTVLETPEGGWWYVKSDTDEGWIPESYLEEIMV